MKRPKPLDNSIFKEVFPHNDADPREMICGQLTTEEHNKALLIGLELMHSRMMILERHADLISPARRLLERAEALGDGDFARAAGRIIKAARELEVRAGLDTSPSAYADHVCPLCAKTGLLDMDAARRSA